MAQCEIVEDGMMRVIVEDGMMRVIVEEGVMQDSSAKSQEVGQHSNGGRCIFHIDKSRLTHDVVKR
jgi:hypothetical protein